MNTSKEMLRVLMKCREYLAEYGAQLLQNYCQLDEQGEPILSTLDPNDNGGYDELKALLDEIDGVVDRAAAPINCERDIFLIGDWKADLSEADLQWATERYQALFADYRDAHGDNSKPGSTELAAMTIRCVATALVQGRKNAALKTISDELGKARQALAVLGVGSIPYSKALIPVCRALAVVRAEERERCAKIRSGE
jgi:hypothetical protein